MMLRRAGLGLLVGAILVAPSVASSAPALLFEPYNGTVLYAEDPDAQWFPASLTKLMTAYVTFQALKAGACGYVLKRSDDKEILEAIAEVRAGGAPMTMQVARKVINHFQKIQKPSSDVEKLTLREQEVLNHLAKGYLYKEIADLLGITINTLRNHLRTIYDKLHVHSRTEATVKYLGRE